MAPASFIRINEIVSVQYGSGKCDSSSSDGLLTSRAGKERADGSPETVLFLSWGDANARHIEKYTKLYNEIYPGSNIILVESGMADYFWRPVQTQHKLVEPVVKMLRDAGEDTLHVHVMSNAGSKQWCTNNKVYFRMEGRTLSNSSTMVDSAPGRPHFKQTWAALSGSLPRATVPRMVLGFVFGIVLCLMHVAKHVLPGPDLLEATRQQLNEHAPTVTGARRCYIYSDKDEVIGWKDVEDHSEEAQKKGWSVDLLKFEGSTHVGHFKQNPEKYREAIERTWSGRSKL